MGHALKTERHLDSLPGGKTATQSFDSDAETVTVAFGPG
jgi:hypothetical protein